MICSSDMPAARYDSTSPTAMRVPRTHGFPKRTLWSIVIRSRGDMAAVYGSPMEATSPGILETDRRRLLFVLLAPAGQPRVHRRPQSILATLLHESDYAKERLMTATPAEEVVEVIRTGEQAALD